MITTMYLFIFTIFGDTVLKILILLLDTLDYASFPSIVDWVEKSLGAGGLLNLLINNAGQYQPDQTLDAITRDKMISEIEMNAVAPLMLTKV